MTHLPYINRSNHSALTFKKSKTGSSDSKPCLSKLTPLEPQTKSIQTCSLKPHKLVTRSSFSSSSFVFFFGVSVFGLFVYINSLTHSLTLRLAMLSMRVWIRNPTRNPLRSLRLDSYTHLNAKLQGPTLSNTAALLG